MPRLLTIMGSGETSPTMVKVHRAVLKRLGPPPVAAVMLDTPFGFQENADELCAKAVAYFNESLGAPMGVVRYRSSRELGTAPYSAAMRLLRESAFAFAGPGSPTYALRHWRDSLVPDVLAGKLATGGAVTFASAAAVTLGASSAPIYEIYKVGEDPRWIPGLDLVGAATGLAVTVIPHYNNAEGGTHDTRYCYLGETRLKAMERELEEGTFVLGIDEHTGIIFDLDANQATIVGNGCVTVRSVGRSREIASGETVAIDRLGEMALELAKSPHPRTDVPSGAAARPPDVPDRSPELSPFLDTVREHEQAFGSALDERDVTRAVTAVLDLEGELAAWASETFSGNERELARNSLHGMVLRLGEVAETGARDPRDAIAPFVDELIALRDSARADGRYGDADRIRDCLVSCGIEVRDGAGGTQWSIVS